MLCGSAFKNKGVQAMLDAVVEYLPAPIDIPPVDGRAESGKEGERKAADDEPFAALAFKIMTDPYVGKLIFFRVYSGMLKTGDTIYNPSRDARSASAASCRCTPTSARRSRKCAPATSPPRWASRKHHRRHALRPEHVITLEKHDISRSRSSRGGRAEDQGRPGEDGHRLSAWRRKIRPSAAHQRGNGPDDHLRAWASCTWRSSSTG